MCISCWRQHGAPTIDNPKVRAWAFAAGLVDPFGAAHIVVEDFNVEDEHLHLCAQDERVTPLEAAWLAAGLGLSIPERASALGLFGGYWEPVPGAQPLPEWFA